MNLPRTLGFLLLYFSGLEMGLAYLSHMVRTTLDPALLKKARTKLQTTLSARYSWGCLLAGVAMFIGSLSLISLGS
jgi:hypothetical protein